MRQVGIDQGKQNSLRSLVQSTLCRRGSETSGYVEAELDSLYRQRANDYGDMEVPKLALSAIPTPTPSDAGSFHFGWTPGPSTLGKRLMAQRHGICLYV